MEWNTKFDVEITSASELKIIYHQVKQNVIEFATYFTMKVTIIYPEDHEIIYTIDGRKDWGIAGKAQVRIGAKNKEIEVVIRAIPIRYGRIAIPEVKVRLLEEKEELEGWVSGNEQVVLVIPKGIVNGIPTLIK